MTTLVVAIVAVAVLAGLLVLGVVLLQRLRRGAADAGHALADELARDSPVHGPTEAEYAGGTGTTLGSPRARPRGVLVLTSTRLLFREVTGPGIEVRREQVHDATVEANFDGLRPAVRRKGQPAPVHLVVRTDAGTAGFVVDDPEAWRDALVPPT